MRNLLLLSTMVIVPATASAEFPISLDIHTNTPIELSSISSLEGSFKTTSVCFMGFGECDPNIGFGKGDDYSVDTIQQCLNEGFSKQNCNSVQIIDGACPYNPSYGRGCKCKPGLITCAAVQIGNGEACNGQYASCQCPTGVSAGAYGCAEYYTYPCGSACKRAYTACEVRTAVSAPYGCKQAWSDCSSKCQIAYTACEARTAVSAPYGCKQAWGDCSSKCQVAYTACEVRTDTSCPYGCASSYADCSSKCQTCKGNPDCDVTSKSCDYGCASANSCSKCTVCKTNPDCDVAAVSCSYGCASTNSCGKCTACKGNPDCDVAAVSCSYGCASTNSCGKCTKCNECSYTKECSGYRFVACVNGIMDSCTACGVTKHKCNPDFTCSAGMSKTTCGGNTCCCPSSGCYDKRGYNQCDCLYNPDL